MDSTLKTKFISVLMPVYNAEKYLDESISSILSQTHEFFEFVIIDDGSLDKSVDIINKYQKKDNRIRFYQNPVNYGVAISRNILLKLARYEYIAWMDADDISLSIRFEKGIDIINQDNSIELVCSQIEIITDDGLLHGVQRRMNYSLYYDLTFFCSIPNPTVLCKKDAIISSGGFSINMPPTEDYDLWSRFVKNHKVYRIEEPLLKYRIASFSISNVRFKDIGYQNTREVTKKNIKFYLPYYCVKYNELLLFQEDFEKIQKLSCNDLITFFYWLNKFNKAFIKHKNPNYNRAHIKKSIKEKKEKIVEYILKKKKIFLTIYILIFSFEIYFIQKTLKRYVKGWVQKYV